MRIAINGFGRIGRTVLRQVLAGHPDIEVVAINDIAPLDMLAYLFRYDSTFGPFPGEVAATEGTLVVGGRRIPVTRQADAALLDWTGVDVLLECTGRPDSPAEAAQGIVNGAVNVLISGPCAGAEATVVLGANDADLAGKRVVSNASCTTNAIAPLLRLVNDSFGIAHGHVTTVHCYTNSQPLVDGPRGAPARSRAAAVSMIPTSTSATRLLDLVLPGLKGCVTGAALRVPAHSVSAIDAVLTLEAEPGTGVSDWLRAAVAGSAVLGLTEDPVVSSDMRARPESLVIAMPELQVCARQLRIFGWYDNEWGFSSRMIDMARRMARRG
ncbi:glyceraldehyde 3-phosphate dehydrogenase NAD-binding domain-containing protein [Mesobacterium sp. TK19101]|uniref:Glyceraldehyde 3-phosphate dehydrogenase NAD-binding domain-containing protein n=1 Tax=Mesobacterium hydrothermale TaxID=3111907 RepID=A0ABU6HLW2_9RHOB|nr:glyceraldehyde 3-phosphate dehydrogenase NAD-binding domain-containing protein [Mesobacterium sp. TK19101]MEC3862160.1 glyceraldehyde 3-phosphate dehydrogenase NAD-binding domain-containing protein [Mesobacterium sp. TK19101]